MPTDDLKPFEDEFEYSLRRMTEPNTQLPEFLSKLKGGVKRGELMVITPMSRHGHSVFKMLKQRPDGHYAFDLEARPFEELTFKDLDWKPGDYGQAEGRVLKRRALVNALLMRPMLSRNQREGHYVTSHPPLEYDKYGKAMPRTKRIRRGPLRPKIVQLSIDSGKFDRLLIEARNRKQEQE